MDYEEERHFSWTDLFIKVIIALIIILFIIWLISLSHRKVTSPNKVVNANAFSENIDKMKEAGQSYFTTSRLPKEDGEVKTITLDKMYKNKMLLTLTDKNGKSCSAKNSYVSISKKDNEYQMKVYLECGKDSDYVIVNMGCYDYCETYICEKRKGTDVIVDDNNDDNSEKTKHLNVEYQYSKDGSTWSDWSEYSEWSKNPVRATDYIDVETKVVNENIEGIHYKFMGHATCPSISNYRLVLTEDNICTYKNENEPLLAPTCPSVSGYKLAGRDGFTCTYNKTNSVGYVIDSVTKKALCDSGYYVAEGGCVSNRTNIITKSIGCSDDQIFDNGVCYMALKNVQMEEAIYYRYRTRKYIENTDYKWSFLASDNSLLSAGYKLTGVTRNVDNQK